MLYFSRSHHSTSLLLFGVLFVFSILGTAQLSRFRISYWWERWLSSWWLRLGPSSPAPSKPSGTLTRLGRLAASQFEHKLLFRHLNVVHHWLWRLFAEVAVVLVVQYARHIFISNSLWNSFQHDFYVFVFLFSLPWRLSWHLFSKLLSSWHSWNRLKLTGLPFLSSWPLYLWIESSMSVECWIIIWPWFRHLLETNAVKYKIHWFKPYEKSNFLFISVKLLRKTNKSSAGKN